MFQSAYWWTGSYALILLYEQELYLKKDGKNTCQYETLQVAGIQQGIFFLVLHQGAFEVHFVEEGEIDVFDADRSVEVFGKFMGDLPDQPVLYRGGLNSQPGEDDQAY